MSNFGTREQLGRGLVNELPQGGCWVARAAAWARGLRYISTARRSAAIEMPLAAAAAWISFASTGPLARYRAASPARFVEALFAGPCVGTYDIVGAVLDLLPVHMTRAQPNSGTSFSTKPWERRAVDVGLRDRKDATVFVRADRGLQQVPSRAATAMPRSSRRPRRGTLRPGP